LTGLSIVRFTPSSDQTADIERGRRRGPWQRLLDANKIEKAPIIEVVKKQPREIILSAFLRMSQQAPFYIFTAFIFAYAVGTLQMPRNLVLAAVLAAAAVSLCSIPIFGHASDRIGRRRMYLIGAALTGLYGFAFFAMVDTAIPALVFIAIVLSLIPHDMQYGPQGALIAEAFTPRLRCSGSSLGYQFASIIAGGAGAAHRHGAPCRLSLRPCRRRRVTVSGGIRTSKVLRAG
jgi:hypothetical protein